MIKRAFFYTTRKGGKTLILLLTLFVISTFVLTGLSILAAADQSALSLRQSAGGSIKLELDKDNRQNWTYQQGVGGVMVGYTGTPITDADIEKVMSVKGIRDYNGIGDGSVFAMDFSFIPGISFGQTRDYSHLPSVSNSEYFNYFRRGAFKLVEGRHITPEDDHTVLISTALAERNGLKLGDTITVQCSYDGGAIAQGTSNLLFSQVAETQPIPEIETPDDGTEYLDITGQYIPYDTSNMVASDSIEVHVTAKHLLWVYLLGMAICTAAVMLASLPVVKMKPKNILSQMS